jgi:hypothetical protein
MQGNNEAARAWGEQALSMVDDERDEFARAVAFSTCYGTFALCGFLDRLDAIEREITSLVQALDNRYLAAAIAITLAPVVVARDPEHAGDNLRHFFVLNDEIRNHSSNSTIAMYLAFHELAAGDTSAAAGWAARSLQLAVDHGPGFIAQSTSTAVPIVKRRSPRDAAVLLGALQAHRARKHQPGTQIESDRETRQEMSLRRALDEEFDALHAQGRDLGEHEMIALAFEQLGAMTHDPT